MKQALANRKCLERYTDKGRCKRRIFDSLVIICASFGTLGSIKYPIVAPIATALIAGGSILKAILPNMIQSEQELSELDRLMDFYSTYINDLERLWYQYHTGEITEKDMIMKLFELKKGETNKYSALNKGVRSLSKKDQRNIDVQCDAYINEVYFSKTDSDE